VESSCELGTEPSGSIKCWECTEWLHNLWALEWYSAPQRELVQSNDRMLMTKGVEGNCRSELRRRTKETAEDIRMLGVTVSRAPPVYKSQCVPLEPACSV
jgi:hypothetical protein